MMRKLAFALVLVGSLALLPASVGAQAGQATTATTKEKTGATSTVKPADGDLSLVDVLRKQASGLDVRTDENGDITVRIRGFDSALNSGAPLLIVDGMRIPPQELSDELKHLNPKQIDRVEVLKDVASTSVYGMQGAHGVILITMKRDE